MNKWLLILSFFLYGIHSYAQGITQTLRGTVIDKESGQPLEGVVVAVLRDSTLIGNNITDQSGEYRIEHVPITRVNIIFSYIGYKKAYIPNVLINSAKEMILNIEMESAIETTQEVVITAGRKGETINEMAVLSARAFSVEETEWLATTQAYRVPMIVVTTL